MFDLEQSVEQWCATISRNRCGQQANVDELKDHLWCEIESHIAKGESEQQAFYLAIAVVGNIEDLSAEYAKNKSLLEKLNSNGQAELFQQVLAGNETMTKKLLTRMVIGNAILWAAAILATSIVLKDTDQGFSVMLILIGLWCGSTMLFGGVKNSAKTECQFIRTKLFSKR